jgi:hypothetical protein
MSFPRWIAAPLLASLLACAAPARADWGGTLALLSDGQERGVSYMRAARRRCWAWPGTARMAATPACS